MTVISHSLRWRLQVWHGAILLVAVLAFCLTAHRLATAGQFRHIDKSLAQNERWLIGGLMGAAHSSEQEPATPDQMADQVRAGTIKLPADLLARYSGTEPGYVYFCFFDEAGQRLLCSDNAPNDLQVPLPASELEESFRTIGTRRESLHRGPRGLSSVVGRDITPEIENLQRFAWSLGALGLGVWALGLLGGWWLAGRAIKPIAAISRTATRIAAGDLTERIDTQGTDSELDQLGRVLNETFDRLHETFEQQKRFTADASHELRTPVTILLSETQRILKRERTSAEYAEAIKTCHDTAARMRRLIEALLLLARQEAAGAAATREACDIATILRDTLAQLAPLAEERSVELRPDLSSAPCEADASALAILATNLVANAIQHHFAGGWVQVSCGPTAQGVSFTVRDNGPGIPAEDQPHIFERFYRVDKARASSAGHTGLGLAIAKTIVDNHGGTISVESSDDRGTAFVVTLPGGKSPTS